MSPKAESLLFCLIQYGLLGRHFFLNCGKKIGFFSISFQNRYKKKCIWDWRMPSRGSEVNFMLFPPSALIYSHQGEEKKWIDLCIVGPGKPGGGPASKSHKKTVGSQFRKKSSTNATDFIDFINFFFSFSCPVFHNFCPK